MESAPVRVPAAPHRRRRPRRRRSVNEEKVCRSPVSGIVVRVVAQAGQSIQAGDVLLVLEAMKMETNITAPVAGKLAAIKVNARRQRAGRPGGGGVRIMSITNWNKYPAFCFSIMWPFR